MSFEDKCIGFSLKSLEKMELFGTTVHNLEKYQDICRHLSWKVIDALN